MVEPNIVFCKFNHIYDAALHRECPYCKKIKEEQDSISRSLVEGKEIEPKAFDDDASTELLSWIKDNDAETELLNRIEKDDAATELLSRGEDQDDGTELLVQEDEDDATELVIHANLNVKNQKEVFNADKPVLGWLVCNSGPQCGRSFEVVEGINYICSAGNSVSLTSDASFGSSVLAELSADVQAGSFCIAAAGGSQMSINGKNYRDGNRRIRDYDTLTINAFAFVFVELRTKFVNWGI